MQLIISDSFEKYYRITKNCFVPNDVLDAETVAHTNYELHTNNLLKICVKIKKKTW